MSRVRELILLVLLSVGPATAEVLDGIVARVDQGVITWSQVLQEREIRLLAGEPTATLEPRVVARALVKSRLFAVEAQKLRIRAEASEVSAEIGALAGGRGAEGFLAAMARIGVSQVWVRDRAREMILTRRYLVLQREMTYVPETEVRAFLAAQSDVLGEKPSPDMRDAVREFLVGKKHRAELKLWMDRQVSEGRVSLPGEPFL